MFTSQNPNPHERKTFVLFRPFLALWHWLFPPTVAHRDRQSVVARGAAAVLLLVVFIGGATYTVMNARNWYNGYQTWQSNRKVDQAQEMERKERLYEAWNLAQEAYHLDPDNPKALRTLARYYGARGQKETFYLLDRLERILEKRGEPLTDEDHMLRIQALAYSQDTKDAQVKIEEVLRRSPPTARIVELADQVLRQRRRYEPLLELLRSYVALKPEDLDIRLTLGMREVQYGTASEAEDGLKILWGLAEDPSEAGFRALKFLDQHGVSDPAQQRKLVDLLQKHPRAGAEERVAALRRMVALEPARKKEIVERALEERKGASREDLVPFARWLTLEGEHARLLDFLTLEMVRDFPPLLAQYLNALTLANRLEELEKLVNDPRTLLNAAERSFYRAHLAFVMKKSRDDIHKLLLDALTAARADLRPQNFVMIAQWSEAHAYPDVAEQAYRMASTNHASEPIQRMGFEGLLKMTYRTGDSKGFLEAARDTANRWPENQQYMERSLYATLLAGFEMEKAAPQAQRLLDAKPDDTARKLLMGLALHRMMDTEAALKVLNNINLSELTPGQGAVLCGILHHGGPEAAAQAKRISQPLTSNTVMLPEERRFLQKVRPEAAVSSAVQP